MKAAGHINEPAPKSNNPAGKIITYIYNGSYPPTAETAETMETRTLQQLTLRHYQLNLRKK